MQLNAEDFGLTRGRFEQIANTLIQMYGANKTLTYTMPPALVDELQHLANLIAIDINAVLNAPKDDYV